MLGFGGKVIIPESRSIARYASVGVGLIPAIGEASATRKRGERVGDLEHTLLDTDPYDR